MLCIWESFLCGFPDACIVEVGTDSAFIQVTFRKKDLSFPSFIFLSFFLLFISFFLVSLSPSSVFDCFAGFFMLEGRVAERVSCKILI